MEQNFSLWERITNDTPTFFKRAQIFGLSLAALGTTLIQIQNIPPNIATVLISAGTAIAAIAQFAVKQYDKNGDDEAK